MILAVGLTPAWQQILLFGSFRPGQVNRAQQAHWCASGKVINVGMAIHRLGTPVRTLSLVGGVAGQSIRDELAQAKIDACWIETSTSTRICTTILDQATNQTTELVENSHEPPREDIDSFVSTYRQQVVSADVVVLSGSLPAGVSPAFYAELLTSTSIKKTVLDFRGPELLESLSSEPLVVKPNREELATTLGRSIESQASLLDAMRELNGRGAQWVVTSDGSHDVFVTSQTAAFRLSPVAVDVVNPIGSGDCLAAGIATSIHSGSEMLDAIRFGIACASNNVEQLLPARLDRQRVDALCDQVRITQV